MENEAREHLNLAQYNFNRMAVIDEEGIDGGVAPNAQGGMKTNELMSAGQERRTAGIN